MIDLVNNNKQQHWGNMFKLVLLYVSACYVGNVECENNVVYLFIWQIVTMVLYL